MSTQVSSLKSTKGKRHLRLRPSFSDYDMWRSHFSFLFHLFRTPENSSWRNSHRRWYFLRLRRLTFVVFVLATDLVIVLCEIFIGKNNLGFLKFFRHWKIEKCFCQESEGKMRIYMIWLKSAEKWGYIYDTTIGKNRNLYRPRHRKENLMFYT